MPKSHTMKVGVISSWKIATTLCPNGHRMCRIATCWLKKKTKKK